jgi:hypothetical protein
LQIPAAWTAAVTGASLAGDAVGHSASRAGSELPQTFLTVL